MSPDDAEAWAAANYQPSFESRPDVSGYDPMAAVNWTLPMVAAWFIWHDIEAVRDQSESGKNRVDKVVRGTSERRAACDATDPLETAGVGPRFAERPLCASAERGLHPPDSWPICSPEARTAIRKVSRDGGHGAGRRYQFNPDTRVGPPIL